LQGRGVRGSVESEGVGGEVSRARCRGRGYRGGEVPVSVELRKA
jgi:hypothetical protein